MVAKAAGEVEVRRSEASPVRLTLQRRDMLSMAIKLSTEPVAVEGLLYEVKVDENCTLCEVCAAKCPTGALSMKSGRGLRQLVFRQDLCIGCGFCLQACPESAMSISTAQIDPSEEISTPKTLRSDELARCIECGAPLGPKSLIEVVYRRLTEKGMDRAAEAVLLCQDCRARKMLEGLA